MPSTQDEAAEWPERLTLRDTKVIADEGQRIYTTATGYGYEKKEYVRADLPSAPNFPSPSIQDVEAAARAIWRATAGQNIKASLVDLAWSRDVPDTGHYLYDERGEVHEYRPGKDDYRLHAVAALSTVTAPASWLEIREKLLTELMDQHISQACCGRGVDYGDHEECCGCPDIVWTLTNAEPVMASIAKYFDALAVAPPPPVAQPSEEPLVHGEHYLPPDEEPSERERKMEEALTNLERAASEVARYGAQTGTQWTRLNSALIRARAALAKEGTS
jgi:hypothetical protein